MKLDFGQFHDLAHPIWACGNQYGGWRRHLSLWWDYKREDTPPWSWWGDIQCAIGRHVMVEWWDGLKDFPDGPPAGVACGRCGHGG